MRSLPSEIWSAIFFLALPDDWEKLYLGTRRLNLAQVCQLWRAVAFGTPRLWTRVLLADKTYRHLPQAVRAELALNELQRTAQVPLQVAARNLRSYDTAVWLYLCANFHRWEHASLEFVDDDVCALLSCQQFPILRTLCIKTFLVNGLLQAFQNSPALSTIQIYDYDEYPPYELSLKLPSCWALSSLVLDIGDYVEDAPSIAIVLDAVISCSGTLRMCDIRTISTRDPPSVSTITLFPHLEEVGLEDAGVLFLDYISAPNIRSITLRGSREEEVEERQALHVLSNFAYRRNGCPRLQSLALLDVDRLTTENAVACLRRLPSLEHLHLGKAAFTERCEILDYIPISFAQALMRNPAAPASLELLPRLASLHVRVDSPQTESAFLAAVDSRRSPTTGARPELACLTACLMVVDRSWTLDEEDDDIDTEMSVAQRNDGISESESHRIWELTVDQTCTLRTMESKTWRMGQMVCKCREGHNESLIPRVR